MIMFILDLSVIWWRAASCLLILDDDDDDMMIAPLHIKNFEPG